MKKRGKPKPKRRARPTPVQQPSRAAAAVVPRAIAAEPLRPAPITIAPASERRATIAANAISADDRTAFALLMLPFVIVALSLMMAQSRRTGLPALPVIAAPAPVERIARPATPAAPPTVALPRVQPASPAPGPAPAPNEVAIPGPAPHFPPPLPVIEQSATALPPAVVAAIAVPPLQSIPAPASPPIPRPDQVVVPGPAVQFPPPAPVVEPVPAPAPPPEQIAVPGPTPVFPPPAPVIELPAVAATPAPPAPQTTIASLDVRPPAPLPAPPPAADPIIATPPPPAETMCAATPEKLATFSTSGRLARAQRQPRLAGVDADTFGRRLSAAALAQTEDLVIYTARYQAMAYPMGDVLAMHGACIDVVIRAYRALGVDLQEEIQRARPSRGDPNIDHRRTENMRRFLERHGTSLPITPFPENYKPGDIVTYYRPFSRISTSHIAVVTDVLSASGRPMIVHNRGYGPQLEDALFVDKITGHYRYMGQPASAPREASGAKQPVVRASFPR